MAFGETAKLLASLELQDKFSKTADKFGSTVSGMERQTSTLGRVGNEAGRGMQSAAKNLLFLGAAGATAIATQVTAGLQGLARIEDIGNQTEAVVKSTGGAANVSAEQIADMADELERLTSIESESIQEGQNMLLTFTSIRNEVGEGNDVFNQATETLLDMSTALGQDASQTAIQLGKALNDPIRGVTALRRVGVQFTDAQTDQIKAMVESNDLMGAQKLILAELNREFGGSAAAFGEGPGAAMRQFGHALGAAQEALATGFLPLIEKCSDMAVKAFANPKVIEGIEKFGTGLAGGIEQLVDIGTKLPWGAIADAAKLMGTGAKALLTAFTSLPPWVQTAVLTGWGLNKLTGGALGNIAGILGKVGLQKLGLMKVTAGVVNVSGPVSGLGGGGAAAGGAAAAGGGRLAGAGRLIGGVLGVGILAALASEFSDEISGVGATIGRGWRDAVEDTIGVKIPTISAGDLEWPFGSKNTPTILPEIFGGNGLLGGTAAPTATRPTQEETQARAAAAAAMAALNESVGVGNEELRNVKAETQALHDPLGTIADLNRAMKSDAASADAALLGSIANLKAAEASSLATARAAASQNAAQLARIEGVERGTQGYTAQVAAKNFSPSFTNNTNVSVNLQAQITAYGISRALQVQQSASQSSYTPRGGDQRF